MTEIYALAATLLAIRRWIATVMSEIVVGSAVVPTLIANVFFLPHHLIGVAETTPIAEPRVSGSGVARSAPARRSK